jgi:phage tail sheath gpL-like
VADEDLLQRIKGLLDEEHAMRSAHHVDEARLEHLEETLDQCWDLLRQRRAKREFSQDEALARVRDVGTVEDYLQ